jgi:hypothetical protein
MLRSAGALLAILVLALPGRAAAEATKPVLGRVAGAATTTADAPPAGTYKVSLPSAQGSRPLWLVKLESKDDKWTGAVTATATRVPPATLDNLTVAKDMLRFTLKVRDQGDFNFEGKLPANAEGKILGSVAVGGNVVPAQLETTTLTSLDPFDVAREQFPKQTGVDAVQSGMALLNQAAAKKAKPEEVRSWADKIVKSAEPYGPRWHREVIADVAEKLNEQEDFPAVALTYARMAERMLDAKDKPKVQKRVLELLATALEKSGKADEAKEVLARAKKIEVFKPEPYAGRKGKSDRVVLVELFTGAECPPCVAADKAFDGLAKTYKPSEVILLQYHLHIPRPDPLTNPSTLARAKFYGDAIEGTPTILFNGKPGAGGGGPEEVSGEKYEEYLDLINPLLEKPSKATLKATATQKGAKIDVKAEVSDLKETGNDVRLRLVLVEEEVDYTGGNKLAAHHCVVRDFPGGTEGLPLKEKNAKQEVTVDLDELRKGLKEYLDKADEKAPFPKKNWPLDLKKLRIVAFVQNDETGEVLQAVQVEVKPQ